MEPSGTQHEGLKRGADSHITGRKQIIWGNWQAKAMGKTGDSRLLDTGAWEKDSQPILDSSQPIKFLRRLPATSSVLT